MADDLYQIMAAATQALRRRVEACGLGLGGALGVAAEPYPHQIATVARILGETTVRHLISDEVGLGKTVQALMILNALRCQNGRHAAVIVAPDRLISQWQNECWTRCHVQPSVFEDEDSAPDARVRLVRPQSLISGAFAFDADRYDLLLVDEPQTMPVQALEVIERAAGDFRQLLILSASPGLANLERRHQLMRMLEPDRAGAADLLARDIDQVLEELELGASTTDMNSAVVYRTWSRARRIIRAGRRDWQRYLPGRKQHHIQCEPLESEAGRVREGLRWAREEAPSTADTWRFGQALHRSPNAAREAISRQVRARSSETLSRAAAAAASSPGDSRLDGLIDILSGIWTRNPEEQVIIVAGDNPSIDYISRRLALYFSHGDSPLVIDELRRAGEAQETEADDIMAMHSQLARFARGEARVLLIGEWIQAGLNLHFFARNVVFYSTPWDPDAIDQLVGRLDRLRPDGLALGDQGRSIGTIDVWTLSQRGSPESEIVASLECLGVFQRPFPPVAEAEMAVVMDGLRAIYAGEGGQPVRRRFEDLRHSWEDQPAPSLIEHLNPFTPLAAQQAYDRLQSAPPTEPIMQRSERATYTSRCEEGFRGLTDLLTRMHMFDITSRTDLGDPDVRFSTIWYSGRRDAAPVRLTELDQGPGWMTGHVPFIYRRRSIGSPPRVTVRTDEGETAGRLLRFLDHGDPLHDGLLEGLLRLAAQTLGPANAPQIRTVRFPEGHPMLELQGRMVLLLTAFADPGEKACYEFNSAPLNEAIEAAPTDAQRARLRADLQSAKEAWRADQRWLRQQAPAQLLLDASVLDGRKWEPLDQSLAWTALKPFAPDQRTVCARSAGLTTAPPPEAVINAGLTQAVKRLMADFTQRWGHAADQLREAIAHRDYQLAEEGNDLLRLRELEIERRSAEPVTALDNLRAGRVAAAERRREFAGQVVSGRRQGISEIPAKLRAARPDFRSLLIRPAPLSET